MRNVGRPRQFDDESERRLVLDAAYSLIRDRPDDLTISAVLERAGVSTRAFYRHFDSKDALLYEMYLRDARWAAGRLNTRLGNAESPRRAVETWIEEIYSFTVDARHAERVAVLGSIVGNRHDGARSAANEGRTLLIESLREAIRAGAASGVFTVVDIDAAAELIAAATMYAAGLATPSGRSTPLERAATTAFCLAALRCASSAAEPPPVS